MVRVNRIGKPVLKHVQGSGPAQNGLALESGVLRSSCHQAGRGHFFLQSLFVMKEIAHFPLLACPMLPRGIVCKYTAFVILHPFFLEKLVIYVAQFVVSLFTSSFSYVMCHVCQVSARQSGSHCFLRYTLPAALLLLRLALLLSSKRYNKNRIS